MAIAPVPQLQIVAKAFSRHKRAVAQCHFEPIASLERWQDDLESIGVERFIEVEIGPPVDYLINYLRTNEPAWRDLYMGHEMEQLRCSTDGWEAAFAIRRTALDRIHMGLLRLASTLVDQRCVDVFDRHLKSMFEIATREVKDGNEVRVLFIGDCFLENMVGFLNIPLLEEGITIQPDYEVSKNPIELRNSLRRRAESNFDIICYSPYTSEFSPILSEIFKSPNPMQSRRELHKMAADAHQQTLSTLRLLAGLFECDIYVQNTNNIRGHNSTPSSVTKNLITRRPRAIVADEVNDLLDRALIEMNLELPRPLVRIDETAFKRQYGELALGRYFYDSDKYHPLVIAQKISVPYRNLILANKLLSSKKIVVIDLDDTVWKGTIGEGAVEHYIERQKILQELRRKGVLLAIVSKNDPRNVHWSGGVLAASDFVAEQINWNPKPSNIRRIASELNLKLKDFVFMDDRADQRELVKSSIAEIQVLDATAESSWDMLRWWAGSLPEQTETDRTQLYLERKQRESFLKVETEAFNQNMLFEVLELKIDFHIAARKELLRVAELINRTNQFNIRGSRASLKQVTARWESSKHRILVAEARDKFGEMGIISAMVLDLAEDALEISVWVLSCRVFGYGIETAMLNVVRRLGRRLNLAVIKGQILETPNNQPCREVYAANGFARQGDIWIGDTAAVSVDPSWLQITTHEDVNLPVVATRLQRQ